MLKSENINELATALAIAQANIKAAKEDSQNPFFKSNYADLASVWGACRKPLTDNGLSIIQTTNNDNDKVIIETTLLHKSGQWITSTLSLKPKADDPQSIGSAITYGRRYSLSAMVGVCSDEDDDGNAASKPEPKKVETNTTEHYCQVHKINFFKRGIMKGYAHQVAGGGWCNEHAIETAELPPNLPPMQNTPPETQSEKPQGDKEHDRRLLYDTIKSRMGFKGAKAIQSVESWLENVEKIDMARAVDEPDKVLKELALKHSWN
jgi:hypothetical protein